MKIAIPLECNEDGYPPIQYELLNATAISANSFRIDNAPFFAPNISYNDIVRARQSSIPEQFDFVELIEGSTFTSISIIILDASMDVFLMDLLRGLNCVIEYGEFGKFRVLAVAVPASTDYSQLRIQLEHLETKSMISFAELAIASDNS
jgi:hypothetical protein